MKKEEIIKVFFKHQSIENQIKIIKNFNIKIDGFRTDKITKDTYSFIRSKILNDLTNHQNMKAIQLTIKGLINADGDRLDHFLSAEKIVEKYENNFIGLLLIANADNFQEKSNTIANLLLQKSGKHPDLDNDSEKSSSSELKITSEKVSELRAIIKKLEYDVKAKETNLQKHIIEKQYLEKELDNFKDQNEKLKKDVLEHKNEIEILEQDIHEKETNYKVAEEKITLLQLENHKIRIKNTRQVHIIGLPDGLKKTTKEHIFYYDNHELDIFMNKHEKNSSNYYFYYQNGLSYHNLRKINRIVGIKSIKNKYELENIIKDEDIL